jgi:hypothetical protein
MSNNTSNQSMPDSNETNEQLLNDIQSLQKMEQDLFSSLETNTNLTPQQQQKIIENSNNKNKRLSSM